LLGIEWTHLAYMKLQHKYLTLTDFEEGNNLMLTRQTAVATLLTIHYASEQRHAVANCC